MQLEMLISSVNQNPGELLNKMHVNCDAVLINQCDKNSEEKSNLFFLNPERTATAESRF